METSHLTGNNAPPNPPSVEAAYKRKCIALKKRLHEIEAENDIIRARNKRSVQYVQKMRLESCILLERLSKVTAMMDEASAQGASAINAELRAKAAAMIHSTSANGGENGNENGNEGYLDDDTEGSSEEQPPTPQERPLRVKRSRKSNVPQDEADADADDNNNSANKKKKTEHDPNDESVAGGGSSLPTIAPAPSQNQLTPSFRVRTNSHSSAAAHTNADDTGMDVDADVDADENGDENENENDNEDEMEETEDNNGDSIKEES